MATHTVQDLRIRQALPLKAKVAMTKVRIKLYDYIMRPEEKGGLNYKEVIDWINEHGNFNIKY